MGRVERLKVGIVEVESLRKWAEKKRITNNSYNEYWGGYVRAIDDILLLMKE